MQGGQIADLLTDFGILKVSLFGKSLFAANGSAGMADLLNVDEDL